MGSVAGVMRRHAYYDHDAAVAAIECLAEFGVTARMGPAIEYLAWGEEPTYEWTVIAPDLPDGPRGDPRRAGPAPWTRKS